MRAIVYWSAGLGVLIVLISYLALLLLRTQLLSSQTSIGPGVILMFHVMCVSTIVFLIAFYRHNYDAKHLQILLIVVAMFIEAIFLGLNISGHVWTHKKDLPGNLIEYLQSR